MPKVYISKLTLPVGNSTVTYDFMDAEARQQLAGGLQFVVCYDGGEPVVADIPAGVVVKYNNVEYTGTKLASTANTLTFYLVKSGTAINGMDIYDEYVAAGSPKAWEKIGDTQFDFSRLKALAFKDSIVLEKGSGKNVLGADAVLTAQDSAVSFTTAHTKANVLGADTQFTAADSSVTITGSTRAKVLGVNTTFEAADSDVIWAKKGGEGADKDDPNHSYDTALGANATFTTSVTPTNKFLKATATSMSIASDGNDVDALTSIGTNTTAAFYDQVDPESKYFERASIYGTDGSESVSAISNLDAEYLALASVPVVETNATADTWAFTYDSTDNELIISGDNGDVMELAANNATVATGSLQQSSTGAGSAIVSDFTITPVSAAKKAANATNVATGALTASEDGASVVYDLDTNTSNAITALGTQNKSSVITGVVATNPTIALELVNSEVTGSEEVSVGIASAETNVNVEDSVSAITGLAAATAEAQQISVDTKEELNAYTAIGNAVAAGQVVTAGSNDVVEVFTALGDAQAAAQTITVTSADAVKAAQYDDLDITIS